LFFNLFPARPLLHECSTVPKGAQQSRAKVAHALFCYCLPNVVTTMRSQRRVDALGLLARRNMNIAAMALANKNARIVWALLAHQRDFAPDYVSSVRGR
jgi:hypothetical protein